MGCWVTGGTPSMSLRSASPCQCTEVSASSWFRTVAFRVSPAPRRITGAGTDPNAQVGAVATTVAWFTEIGRARLDLLAAWTLLVPVFGILLSLLILREDPGLWGWIGTVIVLIAMALLAIGSRRSEPSAVTATGNRAPRASADHATSDPDGLPDENHGPRSRPERKQR